MKIDKYIKWDEIWTEEVCLQTSIDCHDGRIDNLKTKLIIQQFMQDKGVELMFDECYMLDGKLHFFFGETEGKNESDSQGWSRDYSFTVDSDFMIIDAEYEQG